jgi:hypothetical protein
MLKIVAENLTLMAVAHLAQEWLSLPNVPTTQMQLHPLVAPTAATTMLQVTTCPTMVAQTTAPTITAIAESKP